MEDGAVQWRAMRVNRRSRECTDSALSALLLCCGCPVFLFLFVHTATAFLTAALHHGRTPRSPLPCCTALHPPSSILLCCCSCSCSPLRSSLHVRMTTSSTQLCALNRRRYADLLISRSECVCVRVRVLNASSFVDRRRCGAALRCPRNILDTAESPPEARSRAPPKALSFAALLFWWEPWMR